MSHIDTWELQISNVYLVDSIKKTRKFDRYSLSLSLSLSFTHLICISHTCLSLSLHTISLSPFQCVSSHILIRESTNLQRYSIEKKKREHSIVIEICWRFHGIQNPFKNVNDTPFSSHSLSKHLVDGKCIHRDHHTTTTTTMKPTHTHTNTALQTSNQKNVGTRFRKTGSQRRCTRHR